jgi:hypothetical protein
MARDKQKALQLELAEAYKQISTLRTRNRSGARAGSARHRNLFGFGEKKRATTGGKLKSYTVIALHKKDPDADIHPAGTFEAANKKEALTQFRNYLRERGDNPSDYKLEAEED